MLIVNLQLCILVCNAQYLLKEIPFYPCLDVIVDYYYNSHYKYPDSTKELINFTEYFFKTYPDTINTYKNDITVKILPYLKKNKKHILIKKGAGYSYTIQIGNDTLLYSPSSTWTYSPCADTLFIGKDPKRYYRIYEYLRTPRFYTSHNNVVLYPDSVYENFEKDIINLEYKYLVPSNNSVLFKYYIYENDTIPIVSMLEYKLGKPLRYYCNGEQIKPQFPFYEKLESYLRYFCKVHKCKRILFVIPDFNHPNEQWLGYNKKDNVQFVMDRKDDLYFLNSADRS